MRIVVAMLAAIFLGGAVFYTAAMFNTAKFNTSELSTAGYAKSSENVSASASSNKAIKAGAKVDDMLRNNILRKLQSLEPSITSVEVERTPLAGILWVVLPKGEILLMSEDGTYIVGNQLSEIKNGQLETVASVAQAKASANALAFASTVFEKENAAELVVFPAIGKKQASLNVFTDVKCGYCRKFHKDVPVLNKAGIEVRYYAGPFFSKDRASLEQIWCAADRNKAMDQVKAGQKLGGAAITEACKDIVSNHIEIGQRLGVKGTPALYSMQGNKLGGYIPPDKLITLLTSKR